MAIKICVPRTWQRRVKSSMLHVISIARTTFAGAGLAPAGTTDLCTAHLDQDTSQEERVNNSSTIQGRRTKGASSTPHKRCSRECPLPSDRRRNWGKGREVGVHR